MSQDSDNFFSRRWQARVPLEVLLWRDMLGVGTVINLLASFLAMAVIAADGSAGYALALHLAPVPYNLFLVLALHRLPAPNAWVGVLAALWFVLMLVA
jgi:hypothetical protein